MRPHLRAIANAQLGVITRGQALSTGSTERELRSALRPGGPWVIVRRGAYAERWEWDVADEARRHLMRVEAVHLYGELPRVLSHSSAAVVHGLDCRPHWRELVHLSDPDVRGGRTECGVKHHPAAIPIGQSVHVGHFVVTSLARTGVDIAREHGIEDGVVACDQVLARGVPRDELTAVLAQMRYWPNVTKARAAVRLADGGAENPGESLARMLVIEMGRGTPRTQVRIEDDHRRARVDMLLDEHVFEFDGRRKFIGQARGGFAPEEVESVLWQEKQREDWLRSLGFGISRIVWADLFGVRRREALRRLEREYLATQSRRLVRPAS